MSDDNWKERIWNQIRFGMPLTNDEYGDVAGVVMLIAVLGLVVWGVVELIKLIF